MKFAKWLKAQRKLHGHTQVEAAAFLKMSRSKYLDMENEKRPVAYCEEHGLRPLYAYKGETKK